MLKMKKEKMIDNIESLMQCIKMDLKAHDKKNMINDIELAEWWLEQLKEKTKRYSEI